MEVLLSISTDADFGEGRTNLTAHYTEVEPIYPLHWVRYEMPLAIQVTCVAVNVHAKGRVR